jgi:hypothetical protein
MIGTRIVQVPILPARMAVAHLELGGKPLADARPM